MTDVVNSTKSSLQRLCSNVPISFPLWSVTKCSCDQKHRSRTSTACEAVMKGCRNCLITPSCQHRKTQCSDSSVQFGKQDEGGWVHSNVNSSSLISEVFSVFYSDPLLDKQKNWTHLVASELLFTTFSTFHDSLSFILTALAHIIFGTFFGQWTDVQ